MIDGGDDDGKWFQHNVQRIHFVGKGNRTQKINHTQLERRRRICDMRILFNFFFRLLDAIDFEMLLWLLCG